MTGHDDSRSAEVPGGAGAAAAPARAGETRSRWISLLGATGAQVGISYLEQGVPALVPYMKADFGLSNSVAGLYGTSLNVGRAVAGLLAIRPVDRFGERQMILAGCLTSGTLAILAAQAGSALVTLVLLMLSGAAQTLAILAGITAIARWFRYGSRGIAMGIRQAAVPIGGTLAAASLPALALAFGWRRALLVAGGVAIGAALAGMLVYREYEGGRGAGAVLPRLRDAVREVLSNGNIRRAVATGVVLGASQYAVLAYIQLFFVDELGRSLRLAAVVLTVVEVMGIAGRLLWGALSDLVFGGERRGVLTAILVLAATGSIGMGLIGPGQALWLGIPLALVLGLAALGSPGMFITLIADLAPPKLGAASIGVGVATIQSSTVLFPPLFGAIVDATGSYRISWLALAGLLLVTVPVVRSIRPSRD